MIRETIVRYWEQWNRRERIWVVIGIVFLVLYLGYALCFAPLNRAISRAQSHLHSGRETLTWMQQVRQQKQSMTTPEMLSHAELLTIVGQQLASSAFHQYPYQLEQTASGDIQLSFAEVPYNVFLVWLKKLNTHYAFSIKQLSVSRTPAPGAVKLQLVMTAQ